MRLCSYVFLWIYLSLQRTIKSDNADYDTAVVWTGPTSNDELQIYDEKQIAPNCSVINVKVASSCTCFDCIGTRCTVCCILPRIRCCYCYSCDSISCWDSQWQLITIAQFAVSTALLIGIIATVILFFRICSRNMKPGCSRSDTLASECNDDATSVNSVQRYILDRLRDRPPRYNEIYDAPPIYGAECNRSDMSEAPPVYPGTSEREDRIANSANSTQISELDSSTNAQRSPAVVTHHM